MITRHSTREEIDSYFNAKITEYMALSYEMEALRQRSQDAGRQNFSDTWSRYNPNTNRTAVDMAVKWMDGEIASLARRVEAQRQKA